jgi:hypothetical protein
MVVELEAGAKLAFRCELRDPPKSGPGRCDYRRSADAVAAVARARRFAARSEKQWT